MSSPICRIACGVALLVTLGLGACGGDDEPAADVSSEDATTKDGGADASPSSEDKGGPVKIPADVCDIVAASDVGAILGETVVAEPGPLGSCSYDSESRTSLSPQIYLEDAKKFDITGVGEPITVEGNKGYVSAVGDSPRVQHGVLIVNGVHIEVVVSSEDLPGAKPTIEKLLALTAKAL